MVTAMNGLPELGGLRAELRAAGAFDHHEVRSWLKLAVLGAGLAACLIAMRHVPLWVTVIGLIPFAGVLSTSISMTGHEGSHKSFSKSPWRNQLLVYLAFPAFSGLSSLYWRNKHDRLHHGHPNVEGVDPDIKPFPFVSSHGDHEKSTPGLRWFQRNLQRTVFWPMSTLMALGMRRSSILYLVRYPKEHGFSKAWLGDVTSLVIHYTCWMVLPIIAFGPLVGVLVYSSIWAVVGVCLALVFAPAHMGLPITDGQNHDWVHQLETTRNLEMPRFVSYFFIGLDYQVEHHLFPKIPHHNLPRAAAITRAWCQRNGIIHLSWPYHRALFDSAKFMAEAWSLHASTPLDVRAAHMVV
jgi:fatty acid desaturase